MSAQKSPNVGSVGGQVYTEPVITSPLKVCCKLKACPSSWVSTVIVSFLNEFANTIVPSLTVP
ncbi:hypothetical protein D3C86_1904720 [compost metagenome]